MASSYTTFLLLSVIWPDLAKNRFSWPAIYFLMWLFTTNQIRTFHQSPVFICIKDLKKKNQPQRTKFGVMVANQSQFWMDRILPVEITLEHYDKLYLLPQRNNQDYPCIHTIPYY